MGNEMRQRGNEALRYEWLRHVAGEWRMAEVIEMHGFGLSARAGLTTCEYVCGWKSDGKDVLWMPRRADLVEHRNQGILAVGPERCVEVDGGTGGREAQILPVLRDGFPSVLHSQIVPTW